jgi:hypothetical protein
VLSSLNIHNVHDWSYKIHSWSLFKASIIWPLTRALLIKERWPCGQNTAQAARTPVTSHRHRTEPVNTVNLSIK